MPDQVISLRMRPGLLRELDLVAARIRKSRTAIILEHIEPSIHRLYEIHYPVSAHPADLQQLPLDVEP